MAPFAVNLIVFAMVQWLGSQENRWLLLSFSLRHRSYNSIVSLLSPVNTFVARSAGFSFVVMCPVMQIEFDFFCSIQSGLCVHCESSPTCVVTIDV